MINFDEFTQLVNEYVPKIQDSFEKYQNENFPARSPEFFCLELNGEAGELANAEKKSWKGKQVDKSVFEDETADVFIALMNYANSRKINLGRAVARKLKKIEAVRLELAKSGKQY